MAAFGPSIALTLLGFLPAEVHTTFPYAPPGFRDVPEGKQRYDGDLETFDLLLAEAAHLPFIQEEALDPKSLLPQTEMAFRALSLLMARYWQMEGPKAHIPEGEIEVALSQWPRWLRRITAPCSVGQCTIEDLIESSRFLRLTKEGLASMDLDKDGLVTRDEFLGAPLTAPHLLGTDALGRDLLIRLLHGLRLSTLVGLVAATFAALLGLAYGTTAGLIDGPLATLMMRFVDVLYGLPFIFIVILIVSLAGPSLWVLIAVISATNWLGMSRTAASLVRSLKTSPFVEAALVMGASPFRVAITHILPNARRPLLTWSALQVPAAIKEEAFLSFLGLGVQAPEASLGTLIGDGAGALFQAPWLSLCPAITLFLLVFSINLLCDTWKAPQNAK